MARHAKGELAKLRKLGFAWVALVDALDEYHRGELAYWLDTLMTSTPMTEGRYPIQLARPLLQYLDEDAAHGETP